MDMKEQASGAFKDLVSSGNIYVAILKMAVRFLAGAAKQIIETQQKMKENQGKATEFANQLAQIDFNHASFGFKWEEKLRQQQLRNKEFSFRQEELDIRGEQLEIQKSNADIQIEQADLGVMQAELAVKQAAYAMEQAMINIEQASIGLIQAEFGLESATIAAKKADMDYAKKMLDLRKSLFDAQKTAAEAEKKFKDDVAKLYDPFLKLDDAASKYIKSLGGTRVMMENIKKETLDYALTNNLQGKYNISSEELIKSQMKYNQELGRNIRLTGDQMDSLGAMHAMFGDEKTVKIVTALDSFGYDFNRSANIGTKLFKDASAHGVAVEKAMKYFMDNIKMAQTYNFEKGIKGLEEMAEKAAMINFDMSQVSKSSDKLSTIEGSMAAAANMSVLGGSFNALANPLRLFDESLNDMASLQNSIIEVTSGMANFDARKGEVGISGFNRERLRIFSEKTGNDYNSLTESTLAQGRIKQLTPQIDALGLDEDTSKLLKNVAQLDKNGNGFVNLNGTKTSLNDAAKLGSEELTKILKAQTQNENDNIRDIATDVRSFKDNVEAYDKSLYDNEAQILEKSGMGEKFINRLKAQAESSTHFNELGDKLLEVYTKSADLNKEMSLFGEKYAEDTYALQLESADLERRQKHFGVRAAKANLASAELQYKMAPLQIDQAKIQQKTAKIGKDTAKNQRRSADLQYRQAELTVRKYNQIEIPSYDLKNGVGFMNKLRETIYQEKTDKRMDDIYQSTRDAAESLYYTRIATAALAKLANLNFGGLLFEAVNAHDEISRGLEAQAKNEQQIANIGESIRLGNLDEVINQDLMSVYLKQDSNVQDALAVNGGGGDKKYHYKNGWFDRWNDSDWEKLANDSHGHVLKVGDDIYADEIGKRMIQDVSKENLNEYHKVVTGVDSRTQMSHRVDYGNYIRDEEYYMDNNRDYTAGGQGMSFDLEITDTESDSAGTNRLASGGPVGTSKIETSNVREPIVGGKYNKYGSYSKTHSTKKYIGGSLELSVKKDKSKENLNTIISTLMNSPSLSAKFSRYISQEMKNNTNYGYKKTSRYLTHNYM